MHLITGMAISRRSVTLLAIIILLISGVTAYNSLRVDLFPEIEFPLVAITAEYQGANPEAVAAEVTAPIESAISGIDQLDRIQSTSREGNALVLATFVFGTDMTRAESDIEAAVSNLDLPDGVERPEVGRFNPQDFPVMQLSAVSDRDLADIRALVQSTILPALSAVDGVMRVTQVGEVERRVQITVNPERMQEYGISLGRISAALTENNLSTPAGLVFDGRQAMPAKTTHTIGSVEEIAGLIIGASETGPVRLSDVAEVRLAAGAPRTISRTNGKPSISVAVLKEAEANTVEVTGGIRDTLDALNLPDDVEIVIVSDQGPQIQSQIDNLRREAIFGFLFAVSVVFAFMLTIRPSVLRGLGNTLRPTIVIGLSIPLSVFTGVLLLAWQDLTLNFMTLGGLAISVGRVVDDSIVVLENVYRHIQAGRDRWKAALDATTEVGPAIFASTLTTVVVFAPLGFIQGLVGAFFLPFALTVTFALIASLVVALTAVPVLGAYLLRPGDLTGAALEDENGVIIQETWMQRAYTPALRWVLRHKAITLAGVFLLTASSPALLAVIPVTFLPSGGERSITMELSAPPGTPLDATIEQVEEIEARLAEISDLYVATIGSSAFGAAARPIGLNEASFLVSLPHNAPEDIADTLRDDLEQPGRTLRITEVSAGPPTSGVDISITGANYGDIVNATERLAAAITPIEGIENLESNVTQARDEVYILVDPQKAGAIGLSTRQIGLQLSQFLTGRTITTIVIDGERTDVTLAADPRFVAGLDRLRQLTITGPGGTARLGSLATVEVREGPVVISRTNGQRSATITADITSDDTQQVGRQIDRAIDSLDDDPGISIVSGGIFADIAEGFRAIFISMGVGIVLVYLVMVASLGSLRNPLVIVTSLPLALIGVLVALAVTGHSLGIAAMMGVLLLIGVVVTNAIVLITFVEQLRKRGLSVYEALITGGRVRLRPILMTALTTSFALVPLAATAQEGGIVSAELATVVIGGLASSTFLTLFVVPIVYALFNESIPGLFRRVRREAPEEATETA